MRFFNKFFNFIFLLILILPLIFVDLSKNRISVQENRMLADHPKLADIKKHPVKFLQSFDDWFKDSIGFREQLISVYNVMGMNTWMNKYMYKKGDFIYLVGENGHHFYGGKNSSLIRRFKGEQIFSDGQLANLANKLEEIKVYLGKKGIPFLIMLCAFKEEIYPEFYPKLFKRGSESALLDLITDYLKENTDIDIFNIRQALLAEKDNYLLYPVSSGDLSHYTEIGAFFAYRELMKHINIYFPKITPFEIDDIEITYDKYYEGVQEPVVSLKKEQTYKKLDPSFFNDIDVKWLFPWEYTAYENKNPNLPVILVFCDSYIGYYSPNEEKKFISQFLASHFSRAIFIHRMNIKHFEEYIEKYKPDIVVYESVSIEFDDIIEVPELADVSVSK